MKPWNLDITGYRVIEAVVKLERTQNLVPVLQIVQKIPENYCSCLILSTNQVW